MPVREAVHRDPVWRDRADFIVAATIQQVADLLQEREDRGHLVVETGRQR